MFIIGNKFPFFLYKMKSSGMPLSRGFKVKVNQLWIFPNATYLHYIQFCQEVIYFSKYFSPWHQSAVLWVNSDTKLHSWSNSQQAGFHFQSISLPSFFFTLIWSNFLILLICIFCLFSANCYTDRMTFLWESVRQTIGNFIPSLMLADINSM